MLIQLLNVQHLCNKECISSAFPPDTSSSGQAELSFLSLWGPCKSAVSVAGSGSRDKCAPPVGKVRDKVVWMMSAVEPPRLISRALWSFSREVRHKRNVLVDDDGGPPANWHHILAMIIHYY